MEIEWSLQAEADLEEIADYYGQFDPALPDRLIERAYQAPKILCEQPRLGARVDETGLRKWPVRKTPFLLFYQVLGERIAMVRVVHATSDWMKDL